MSEATANTTKPAAPKPHKNHPDAELFRLCEEAAALHDKMEEFFKDGKYYIHDDDQREKQLKPLRKALSKLVSSLNRIRAHTIEGIQARAKLVIKIFEGIDDMVNETYYNISIPAAITRDLINIDLSSQFKTSQNPAPMPGPSSLMTEQQLEALKSFAKICYFNGHHASMVAMRWTVDNLLDWTPHNVSETLERSISVRCAAEYMEKITEAREALEATGVELFHQ